MTIASNFYLSQFEEIISEVIGNWNGTGID